MSTASDAAAFSNGRGLPMPHEVTILVEPNRARSTAYPMPDKRFRVKGLNALRKVAILEPLIGAQADGDIHDTRALELE